MVKLPLDAISLYISLLYILFHRSLLKATMGRENLKKENKRYCSKNNI